MRLDDLNKNCADYKPVKIYIFFVKPKILSLDKIL